MVHVGPGSSCLPIYLLRWKCDTARNRVQINLSTGISVYFSVCAFCIICTNDSGWRLLPIIQVMCLLWYQPSDIDALCSSIAQSSQDTIIWQPYTNSFVQDPCHTHIWLVNNTMYIVYISTFVQSPNFLILEWIKKQASLLIPPRILHQYTWKTIRAVYNQFGVTVGSEKRRSRPWAGHPFCIPSGLCPASRDTYCRQHIFKDLLILC